MDTRTRILDAAVALIAEGGLQQLTQPRVAKAAGVRQSHLTYYFPTIADLLQAVARHTVDALVAEIGRSSHGADATALLDGIAAATADKRRVRTMLSLVTVTEREPTLRPHLREYIAGLRGSIGAALAAAGIVAASDDVAFLHAVIAGSAVLQLACDNPQARHEAREALARALACLRRKD